MFQLLHIVFRGAQFCDHQKHKGLHLPEILRELHRHRLIPSCVIGVSVALVAASASLPLRKPDAPESLDYVGVVPLIGSRIARGDDFLVAENTASQWKP